MSEIWFIEAQSVSCYQRGGQSEYAKKGGILLYFRLNIDDAVQGETGEEGQTSQAHVVLLKDAACGSMVRYYSQRSLRTLGLPPFPLL